MNLLLTFLIVFLTSSLAWAERASFSEQIQPEEKLLSLPDAYQLKNQNLITILESSAYNNVLESIPGSTISFRIEGTLNGCNATTPQSNECKVYLPCEFKKNEELLECPIKEENEDLSKLLTGNSITVQVVLTYPHTVTNFVQTTILDTSPPLSLITLMSESTS
jgi:hypothetical protein